MKKKAKKSSKKSSSRVAKKVGRGHAHRFTAKQVVEAARLVYEKETPQRTIAKKWHVSSTYVSRILKAARENGTFGVKVVDLTRGAR